MIEDGRRRAEEEHRRWKAELQEAERRREQERRAQAWEQSKAGLSALIAAWGEVVRLEGFFADAERRVRGLPEERQARLLERLTQARQVVGGADALQHLEAWRTPGEVFEHLTEKARRPW